MGFAPEFPFFAPPKIAKKIMSEHLHPIKAGKEQRPSDHSNAASMEGMSGAEGGLQIAAPEDAGRQAIQMAANTRPEVLQQKSTQAAANASPAVRQLMAFQHAAGLSSHTTQLKAVQTAANATTMAQPLQRRENRTGLPDELKSGVEGLSGMAMDDVKVHYNSDKPGQLQAHAYAQGTDIHVAPGQEQHLPHEAWHVVQQKQGRVQATTQLKGKVNVNDDAGLEKEADVMGAKALQMKTAQPNPLENAAMAPSPGMAPLQTKAISDVVQRMPDWLNSLIDLARNNPIASLTTAGVGAAGLLAYYYWRRQPEVPVVVEELAPPNRTTIAGVAAQIGVGADVLTNQLENGIGDIDISQFYAVDLIPWQGGAITGAVPPSLIADLPEAPQAKVDELFTRLNAWPFSYTGTAGNGVGGFLSRQGDCRTLASMFQLATQAAGIEGVTIEEETKSMLVDPRAIHGRTDDNNVSADGPPYWYFDNHYWCVYEGQAYDLLFRNVGAVAASYQSGTRMVGGQEYQLFPNGMALSPQGGGVAMPGGIGLTQGTVTPIADLPE